MRFFEFKLPKNEWQFLFSTHDKQEAARELVDLVQTAYLKTPRGSMIKSFKDVIPSDWSIIDWDADPDIDACVFYRHQRNDEAWIGYKIQGIGHDNSRISKDHAINKVKQLLEKPGVWIESSDAMRHVLKKLNLKPITDETLLQKLFNNRDLEMIDQDTYKRKLEDGSTIYETVFGNPILKEKND